MFHILYLFLILESKINGLPSVLGFNREEFEVSGKTFLTSLFLKIRIKYRLDKSQNTDNFKLLNKNVIKTEKIGRTPYIINAPFPFLKKRHLLPVL